MKQLQDIIKVAAFDVDGTILPNGTTRFSEKTRSMFKLLKDKGITTVISTAREFATIGDFLEQLDPVDYFIGANGAFIWDNKAKQFIFKASLIKEEVVDLYDRYADKIDGFSVTDFDTVYKSPKLNVDTWFAKPFEHNYKDFDDAYLSRTDLYVVTITSQNTRELSNEVEEYIKQKGYQMEVSARWSHGFFLGPVGITKSHTLEILCNKLGYSMNNLIAFGDSSNDYEMIKDAFYGVAMERANDKIKRVAKDIAMDCEYDGCYWKLKELKLI
ncbi:YcsE-related riboflavin metabolism phosphatase [Mycoplasma corogypsi]|uniref:YcsE-related riboflavin metabolism phosphatase n=1 Tax=Mycoplasma corogypsi TaxID=2106 RepID=UPI003872CC1E